MILAIPSPPSANRYWRSYTPRGKTRAIVVVSDEAKAFKTEVAWLAKAAGMKPMAGRVHLHLRLFPGKPQDAARRMKILGDDWDNGVRSIDLDNALKVTIDALNGIAYMDDSQVWRLTAERCEPDGKARAEVEVNQIIRILETGSK